MKTLPLRKPWARKPTKNEPTKPNEDEASTHPVPHRSSPETPTCTWCSTTCFCLFLSKLFPKWWDPTQPAAPSRNASPRAGCKSLPITSPPRSSTSPGPDAGLRPTGRVGERSCAGADLWLASLSTAGWRGWARMTEDGPAVSQELTQSPARRSSFSTASTRLGGGMSGGNGWRLVR